jgi:uncharacterized protein with LGFP repeats
MRRLIDRLFAPKTRSAGSRRKARSLKPVGEGLEPRLQLSAQALGVVAPPVILANVSATPVTPHVNVTPATDPIAQKYASLGGPNGFLGSPISPEVTAPDGIGRLRDYEHGVIFWSPSTGAHEVHGAILSKYISLGATSSFLGYPTTDESAAAGSGRFNAFQNGRIYWSPSTGAHEVHGAILGEYLSLGGSASFLGFPTSDESPAPSSGRFNTFQGGNIYWTPTTGAHEVHGAILGEYLYLGGPNSFLGFPTSDESPAPNGGRFNTFQGGRIYWTPSTGAHEVHGAILGKYLSLSGPSSFLGYPNTDEQGTSDGVGRFSSFQGGLIYWTPSTGAHEVHGAILGAFLNAGGLRVFGYPVADEGPMTTPPGRISYFQHGYITWVSATGATFVHVYS